MPLGLQAVGTQVYRDGKPFRHIGVNHYSLFQREFINFGIPNTGLANDCAAMAAAGIKVCRVAFGFYDYPTWRDYYYNAQAAYWAKVDQVMDALAAAGLMVIANMGWNLRAFTQLSYLSTGATIAPRMLADKSSALYTLFENYVTAFVTRYKNHPAIAAWQFGNENSVALGNEYYPTWLLDGTGTDGGGTHLPGFGSNPPAACNWGTKPEGGTYAPGDKMSNADYQRFCGYFRDICYRNDPWARMVISGDAMGNAFAVTTRRANSLANDSSADWGGRPDTGELPWITYREREFSVNCNHIYPLATDTSKTAFFSDGVKTYRQHIQLNKTWADAVGKPFVLEEFGSTRYGSNVDPVSNPTLVKGSVGSASTEQALFTEALQAIVDFDVPLACVWNWTGNVASTTVDWQLWDINHSSRIYQLQAIQAVNATRT